MPRPEQLIAERLKAFPEVERIVLFGSRARGDAGPRSDIDLAVSCPDATASRWSEIVDSAENAPTLLQIDLIRLETAPPELLRQISREGLTLYERNSSKAAS